MEKKTKTQMRKEKRQEKRINRNFVIIMIIIIAAFMGWIVYSDYQLQKGLREGTIIDGDKAGLRNTHIEIPIPITDKNSVPCESVIEDGIISIICPVE